MKNLLYILLLILLSTKTQAQITGDNYPVQAHVFVSGAGSLKLSDYFTSSTKLGVDLILKDLTKSSLDVYLSWEIEGLGLGIQGGSSPGFVPGSFISLNRGSVRKLNGIDLRAYFQPGVVVAAGVTEAAIFSGSLPEGFYVLRVKAYEAGTGREVSNRAETYFSVAYALPPVLNQPLSGTEQTVTRPQNVLLQWTPRHTSTGSNLVTYQLKVCEVDEDDEPNVAILGSQTCFTVPQQTATSYLLKASDLPLKPGKRYAWQVQATDLNGALEFQNTGFSEVAWFRYGKACTAPEGLAVAEIGPNRVNLSWKADPQAIGYKVYYKNETAIEWQTQTTFGTSISLNGLDKKESYSFKISTLCNIDNESPTSPEETWEAEEIDTELQDLIDAVLHPLDQISSTSSSTLNSNNTVVNASSPDLPATKAATETLPISIADLIPTDPAKIPCKSQVRGYENCSDSHTGVDITGTVPLPSLVVGDPLTIYDMLAIVTEVSGGPGIYSGKALVKLPMLNDMMMAVEFSNVSVIQEDPAIRGGCVTNVPSNGYFRARTGLSREELKAEEVALINAIRNQIQPGNDLKTFSTIINEQGVITEEINSAQSNGSVSPDLVENYILETTELLSSLNDWKDNLIKLDKSLSVSDLTFVISVIESLSEDLTQSIADIQTDPINTKLPTETGSKITSILDILKGVLNNGNDQKPPVVADATTTLKDKKTADLSWTGDNRFTHYMVSYQTEGQGEVLLKTENTSINLSALKENSIYNIKVTGIMQEYTSNAFTKLQTKGPDLPRIQITHSDLDPAGKYKVEWTTDPIYTKYLFKYTDTKGFVRYVNPTKNSVLFSEFDYNQEYTYTLVGITKDGSRSDDIPGNFLVNANCPFLSEIILEATPEKIVTGDQLNLSVKPSANLACLSQIEWYNKFEQLIGTGRNISVEMNYSNATITAKCKSMLGQSGTILTDCSISRQFDIIEAQCEVTNVTASKTNVFEGEEIMLSISNGCFRGSESYWLKDGEIIGQGDKIYVKPELNSTSPYYAVCQDGDFSCASPAPAITVRPLCEKMELTFPRFTDEYLLVQAVNCPNVAQWTWTNANVKKAAWTKKDGFQKGYLEQFSEENAILLKLNDANNFSITARCEQTPCTATKTFNDNSACSTENCTTIPVVTYLGDDFYEVRLVQSLLNESAYSNYIDFEKIKKKSGWDWLSPKIADNYQDKLIENRKEAACDYQIPAFNWLELNSTKPNQIIQAKDLPQVYHVQKKLTVQNGFEPFGTSLEPVPIFEVTENCTQQLEILIPKKGNTTSENVNFELKTISLPNGEEYIFPTGCQNQWEEGLVVIDLPNVPATSLGAGTPTIPGIQNRQIFLKNSEVVPIQIQEKPWQIRFTCMVSGSTIPLTYTSKASAVQVFETAAIWAATLATVAYGVNMNVRNQGNGLPIFEDVVKDRATTTGVYIEGLLPNLFNFIRNNYNSTWIDYKLLDDAKDIPTSVGPERYQTTNVVKRVVNELCKELSSGNYTKAQKKEILCQLQQNIKAASPTIKAATDAEIEAFANGDCSKIIKLWTNAAPIAKATAEGILAKNKDLLSQGGQGDCSPSNETLIVNAEIVQQPTCDGQKGEVRLTATGGNGSYQYKLSTSPSWQRETRFTNLNAGTYVFEARDTDGNKGSTTMTLGAELQLKVIATAENASCSANGGKLILTVNNGCQPFDYSIDGGNTFRTSTNNTMSFENLAAGVYNWVVKDQREELVKGQITIPDVLELQITTKDANCGANGSLNLQVTGGTAPYQYSFDNGTTWQASSTQDGLCPATFGPFKIKDANGCEATADAVTLTAPETLELAPADAPIALANARTGQTDEDDYITLTFEGKTVRVKIGANWEYMGNGTSDILVNGKAYTPFFIACSKEFYGFYETTCTASPCTITTYENSACGDGETVRLVFNGQERCKECWLEVDEIEKNIIIFANGYLMPIPMEFNFSDNSIHKTDFNGYWNDIDNQFISRRKPDVVLYGSGHFSIATSNHNPYNSSNRLLYTKVSLENLTQSAISSYLALASNGIIPLPLCFDEVTRCVNLNTTGNSEGFNYRYTQAKDYGTINLVAQLKNIKTTAKNVKYNIDIVSHSMGFAYSQGLVDGLKSNEELKNKIHFSGNYIIAPENGGGGTVNPTEWEQIWQYGSNLGEANADPLWKQDGVAPQSAVKGLEQSTAKYGRAFIPDTYTTTHNVIKSRYIRTDIDPAGNPIPIFEYYEETQTDKVPKDWKSCHQIANYGWIFERTSTQPGYVLPK